MHARFGELLGQWVRLSAHDVHEILEEQQATHRRFGEIALSWGLCQPEHIWRAWVEQVDPGASVDLDLIGVDAQAVALLPMDVAERLHVIPIRRAADHIVMATAGDPGDTQAFELLRQHLPDACDLRLVRADRDQIRRAIDMYYHAAA